MRTFAALALAATLLTAGCAPEKGNPDTIVYMTKGGARYHRKECRLKTGSHGIPLRDVPDLVTPCKVCEPPVLDKG